MSIPDELDSPEEWNLNYRLNPLLELINRVLVLIPTLMSRKNHQKTMLSSEDYHAHILKVHRSQSVLTDVPRYPNAHLAFNNQHGHHNPHSNERVEEVENDQTTYPGNESEVVHQETVDVERDQYTPRKNKGRFELHKWKTYRP
ncbi:hypothetical protein E2542_SST19675 [Spatholobus suberectus]|nr:hypothetical protein E2542_SST19675 [Spatholobus suberectus]